MFDVTYFGALIAGLLSFLSPCILPIVPFYLSYLAGVSVNQVAEGAALSRPARIQAILATTCFALGVITVFMGLGASATVFGQMVRDHFDILRWIAAAVIIAMGLHFLGVIRIGFLYRQFRSDGANNAHSSLAGALVGAYVIGLAFAFGWTPCVGPVLATILFTAAGQESASQGAVLLFIYGLGMTLPFIIASLFIGPFMAWMARFQKHLNVIEKLMGALLIVFGILIATNSVNILAQWMLDYIPWLNAIG